MAEQSSERIHGVNASLVDSNDNLATKNQDAANTIKLIKYSFIMPLIIQLLSDGDVLVRLLLTGKSMKPPLIGYRLKSAVSDDKSRESDDRYLPVIVTRVDFAAFDILSTGIRRNDELIDHSSIFNPTIAPNSLPDSVKVVHFSRNFGAQIRPGDLPSNVREVRLGDCTPAPLIVGSIPNGVETLDLRLYAHPLQPGIIPSSVTNLSAKFLVDNPFLPSILPSSLKCLIIGREKSSLASRLPDAAGHISLEDQSSHHSNRLRIPPSLTRLLSPCFSHSMQASDFPESLTDLDIVYDSDMSLVLPKSILKLSIICLKSHFIVPDTVEHLTIRCAFLNCDPIPIPPGVIPPSVKHLDVRCPITVGSVPDTVQHLCYQDPHGDNVPVGAFPDSLKTLLLLGQFGQFNQDIEPGLIPHGVKELVIGGHFYSKINVGAIPNSVEKLIVISSGPDALPPSAIPDSVTWLQLGDLHTKLEVLPHMEQMGFQMDPESRWISQYRVNTRLPSLVPDSIPASVTTLTLPTVSLLSTDQSVIIPNSVTSLHIFGSILDTVPFDRIQLGISKTSRFTRGMIPSSVVSLRLRHIDVEIEDGFIPDSVKDLFVPVHFQVPSHVKANITYEAHSCDSDRDDSEDNDEEDDMEDDDDYDDYFDEDEMDYDDYDDYGY